jgi:hypothetical protein
MGKKYKLFLSSTSDLEAARESLRAELPNYIDAFNYTLKGAEDIPVKDVLLEELKKTHVFVGLLGGKWGSECPKDWIWPYPEPKYPDPERSISFVEWEFLTARGLRQSSLMIFVQKIDEEKIDDTQKQFINYLDRVVWSPRFATETDLKLYFWRSFNEWRDKLWERNQEKDLEISEKFFPLIAALAVLAFLLFAYTALTGVHWSKLIIIGVFSLATLILCLLLTRSHTGGK